MTLTPEEIAMLRERFTSLPPLQIGNVSQTQLSIARHYGGCSYNGHHYVYDPTDDTLMRDDAFRAVMRKRRETEKAAKAAETSGELFGRDA